MKNYEITYTKGHLVDIKTNKRIFLKRGGKFFIQGDDDQFEEKDEREIELNPLNAEDKIKQLFSIYPGAKFIKIAEEGTEFEFRIGLGRKISDDKDREYFFKAVILEDLYFYSSIGNNWRLCYCACEAVESLDNRIQMIETIKADSLNSLFGNVVTFFFPFQRSTACNAFKTFRFKKSWKPHFIGEREVSSILTLEDVRFHLSRKDTKDLKNYIINMEKANPERKNKVKKKG